MTNTQNAQLSIHVNDDNNSVDKKRIRRPFSDKEDQKLRKLVHKFGEVNAWKKIADRMKGRNVRQCRERWMNALSEKVLKSKWTHDEDKLLLQKYDEIGAKWKKMENFFPGRIQYQIRNRFKTLARLNQQTKMNSEIDSYDELFIENDENEKKIEIDNMKKNDSTNNEACMNIISFFRILDNQKNGEKIDIFKSRVDFEENFFEFEKYWSNFIF